MSNYYDIHCHVFNKDVIIRRLVNVVEILLDILHSGEVDASGEKLQSIIDNLDVGDKGSSEDVFSALNEAYKGKFTITPLMMDLTFADDNDGGKQENKKYKRRIKRVFKLIRLLLTLIRRKMSKPESKALINELREVVKDFYKKFEVRSKEDVEIFDDANYTQQLVDLEFLAKKYDNVKPFFSYDPRQNYKNGYNTIDTLKDKLLGTNPKYSGIKLYAPLGYSPTDPVLMGYEGQQGVYDFCVQHNIPITVHNSNAGFACFSTHIEVHGHLNINGNATKWEHGKYKFDYKFFSRKAGKAIEERARILNHPRLWEVVLQKHPNLTINFAHFGGSGQIMDYIHYRIHEEKIEVDDFEELVSQIPKDMQETIRSAYTKRWDKMILKKNLRLDKQQNVWNAMYYAGLLDNWAKAIFQIVRNPAYPNAYTDLSCFSDGELLYLPGDQNEGKVFSIKESLNEFKISIFDKVSDYEKSKFLYGSDYFLLQFFGVDVKQYLADFKSVFGDDFKTIASINPERFLFVED